MYCAKIHFKIHLMPDIQFYAQTFQKSKEIKDRIAERSFIYKKEMNNAKIK